MIAAIFDGGRRETWFFTALAVLLVLVRSAVFIIHGYVDFDSDQAIMGLMAKHLSEFRAFPLFYYGQNYMLGAQSWIIAPLFWIARPSIALQKTPMTIINAVAAVLIVRLIIRDLHLRPALAFLAAVPFIVPTPIVAGTLLQGVEPLFYILILWMLRDRPFAFGALLAFGVLHREFTIYALPALALAEIADGTFWDVKTIKRAALGSAGFALIWLVIDDAKMHMSGAPLSQETEQLGKLLCLEGPSFAFRVRYILTEIWPVLVGGDHIALDHYAMRSATVIGLSVVGWAVGGAVLLMLFRIAWLWRLRRGEGSIGLAIYLAVAGVCALAAYALTCAYAAPVVRYFTLGLLLPVGCFAAFMAWEPSALLRKAVIAVFVLWGTANLVDSVRVLRDAQVNPQANPHGELTEFLLSHQIRYARASYWDSYIVDFLSRERVIVASTGPVRIPEYGTVVDEHNDAAVGIVRMPCVGQLYISAWCIQLPVNRPGEGAH